MHAISSRREMQQCIDECLHCYRTCKEMAMSHCLQAGGRHVEPEHFRLMMNCSEICRTAADFMLSTSPLHAQVCAACAAVCDACAENCEQIGEMDDCVQACRACALSCHQMSESLGAIGVGTSRQSSTSLGNLPA